MLFIKKLNWKNNIYKITITIITTTMSESDEFTITVNKPKRVIIKGDKKIKRFT